MKRCRDCGKTKPLTDFRYTSAKKRYPDAPPEKHLQSYCKKCDRIRSIKWRKENVEAYRKGVRSYHVRSRYNVSHEEAERLDSIKACEICGSTYRLGIDHCHETLVIRGVLCSKCNLALGHVKDNPEILQKMIDYLAERV